MGSSAPENCILVLLYVAFTIRAPEKLTQSLEAINKTLQNMVRPRRNRLSCV